MSNSKNNRYDYEDRPRHKKIKIKGKHGRNRQGQILREIASGNIELADELEDGENICR